MEMVQPVAETIIKNGNEIQRQRAEHDGYEFKIGIEDIEDIEDINKSTTIKAESQNYITNSDVADTDGVEARIELQMNIFRNE